MIPTWTYVKSKDGIYTNLFIGSSIKVEDVAGTNVEMVQKTDYPWRGNISITVNPEQSKRFSVYVRIPGGSTSELYTESPVVKGYQSFKLNGKSVTPKVERGYAVITREWKKGDKIEVELPLQPQRVVADERIQANRGRVALKYGPLIYNVERADQENIDGQLSSEPIRAEWRPDLLGGVVALTGKWKDGLPMLAVPNYTRMNRVDQVATIGGNNSGVNYAPGTSGGTSNANATPPRRRRRDGIQSMVWIRDDVK